MRRRWLLLRVRWIKWRLRRSARGRFALAYISIEDAATAEFDRQTAAGL